MTHIGYALSSEEHGPSDLVRWAVMAEQGGKFALVGMRLACHVRRRHRPHRRRRQCPCRCQPLRMSSREL